MTDSIGSVGGSPFADGPGGRGRLIDNQDQSAFQDLMSQGLGTLSQRPVLESQADRLTSDFTGAYAGDVGQAKSEIVGGEAAKIDRSSEAANATLEDRIKTLYTELTHYQIAWKIAQNVQRDVSQVLRGS